MPKPTTLFRILDNKIRYLRYAHLREISDKIVVGSQVAEGQLIGKTGLTGNAINLPGKEANLHFEIMKCVNPGVGSIGNKNRLGPADFISVEGSSKAMQK